MLMRRKDVPGLWQRARGFAAAALLAGPAIAAAAPLCPNGAPPVPHLFAPSFSTNTISVVDLDTNTVIKTIGSEARGPGDAYATPDGKQVFILNVMDPVVTVVDVASLAIIRKTRLIGVLGDRGAPVPSDGRLFWSSTLPDGTIEAVDTATGKLVRTYPLDGNIFRPSHDGSTLYTVNLSSLATGLSVSARTFSSRDAATGAVIGSTTLPFNPNIPLYMYVTPDDSKAYVQLFDDAGTVHVVDVRDRRHPVYLKTLKVGSVPVVAGFRGDGRQLWFPNSGDGTVAVVDTATDEVVQRIFVGPYLGAVAFSGNTAYVMASPSPPIPPNYLTSSLLLFAGLIPGAMITPVSGTTRTRPFELSGELRLYDAYTYQPKGQPPIRLPSASYIMGVVGRCAE